MTSKTTAIKVQNGTRKVTNIWTGDTDTYKVTGSFAKGTKAIELFGYTFPLEAARTEYYDDNGNLDFSDTYFRIYDERDTDREYPMAKAFKMSDCKFADSQFYAQDEMGGLHTYHEDGLTAAMTILSNLV